MNAYSKNKEDRHPQEEELVGQYLSMVKHIASRLASKAPQGILVEDLVGAGMLGLADAVRRYDSERSSQFEAYAKMRIHGAIIDEIRSRGPLSRNNTAKSRRLTQAIRALEHQFGRQPMEQEIAEKMNITLDDYRNLLLDLQKAVVLSPLIVQQAMEGGSGFPERAPGNPQDAFLFQELRARLAKAISKLSDKEQHVLSMYYKDEISLKKIGEVFGVSESRACQIRAEAVHRLRAMLEEEEDV